MAVASTTNTVRSLLALAGVDDSALFNNETKAERMASDMFDDSFESCLDKTFDEIDADLKIYANLTVNSGKITVTPRVKRSIKAFVQWTKDMLRTGRDPVTEVVNNFDVAALMRRYKTHLSFVKKSSTMATTANPSQFASDTKWEDWEPTFKNFLRTIPGRDGVPLDYVIRINNTTNRATHIDMLEEYAQQAPLRGPAFQADAAEVHTYITKYIAGNATAEAKIQAYTSENNGRRDFTALRDHYEGVGINAVDIIKADTTLETLYYSGEKRPHMWWDLFERQLTSAFTTYNKKEQRDVHSDEMKLRILVKKINADFLQSVKAGIQIELTRVPLVMTYERALAAFRNEVNRKFSTETPTKTRRSVKEANSGGKSRGGRGRGRGGRGSGRGGKGRRPGYKRKRETVPITLTDGTVIDYHPSIKFSDDVFRKFKPEDKIRLYDDRARYKRQRMIQAVGINQYGGHDSNLPPPDHYNPMYGSPIPPPYHHAPYSINNNHHISQANRVPPPPSSDVPNASIMGGRNSQAGSRHYQGGRPS